jgi:hypothetical protein
VVVVRAGPLAGACAAGALLCATGGAEPVGWVELALDPPQAPITSARPAPAITGSIGARSLLVNMASLVWVDKSRDRSLFEGTTRA